MLCYLGVRTPASLFRDMVQSITMYAPVPHVLRITRKVKEHGRSSCSTGGRDLVAYAGIEVEDDLRAWSNGRQTACHCPPCVPEDCISV